MAQDDTVAELNGTLRSRNADNEQRPVAGVEIIVSQGGAQIASVISDEDGKYTVKLPDAGTYEAKIISETLPEDTTLKEGAKDTLQLTVREGQSRTVIFSLSEGEINSGTSLSDQINKVLRLLTSGIRFGLILAMCSIGLSLIFGTTSLVNFAHGELVTLGAVFTLVLDKVTNFYFAAAMALILTAIAGYLNDKVIWKPLRKRGAGLISMMVISIGLSILLRFVVLWQIGGDRQSFSRFKIQKPINLGPFSMNQRQLIIVGLSIAILIAVAYAINNTRNRPGCCFLQLRRS